MNDDPGLAPACPIWKFGMKMADLAGKLNDQYNTISFTLQDPEAFRADVSEISSLAKSLDQFHDLMAERKKQRMRELNESLDYTGFELIANPKLIGSDSWEYALPVFRDKSLDAVVRYFAHFLPARCYAPVKSTMSSSSSSCYSSFDDGTSVKTTASSVAGCDERRLFFDDGEHVDLTDEPLALHGDHIEHSDSDSAPLQEQEDGHAASPASSPSASLEESHCPSLGDSRSPSLEDTTTSSSSSLEHSHPTPAQDGHPVSFEDSDASSFEDEGCFSFKKHSDPFRTPATTSLGDQLADFFADEDEDEDQQDSYEMSHCRDQYSRPRGSASGSSFVSDVGARLDAKRSSRRSTAAQRGRSQPTDQIFHSRKRAYPLGADDDDARPSFYCDDDEVDPWAHHSRDADRSFYGDDDSADLSMAQFPDDGLDDGLDYMDAEETPTPKQQPFLSHSSRTHSKSSRSSASSPTRSARARRSSPFRREGSPLQGIRRRSREPVNRVMKSTPQPTGNTHTHTRISAKDLPL